MKERREPECPEKSPNDELKNFVICDKTNDNEDKTAEHFHFAFELVLSKYKEQKKTDVSRVNFF